MKKLQWGWLVITAVVLAWIGMGPSAAGRAETQAGEAQQVFPVPTPAPDATRVVGDVSVVNSPMVFARQEGRWLVEAQQLGSWKVELIGGQGGGGRTPGFLQPGRSYAFTWPAAADRDVFRVVETRDGWVLAEPAGEAEGGRRWLNPATVATIEELER